MDEREIIDLSNEIIDSLTKLALSEKPGMLSGKVFKSLSEHAKFSEMKFLYADFVRDFKGGYSSTEDLKKLTDFRYKLVDLFNQN